MQRNADKRHRQQAQVHHPTRNRRPRHRGSYRHRRNVKLYDKGLLWRRIQHHRQHYAPTKPSSCSRSQQHRTRHHRPDNRASINQHVYKVPVLVVDTELLYPIILGMSFLTAHKGIIDIGTSSLKLRQPTHDIAYLDDDFVLPPFTECVVSVNVVSSELNKTTSVEQYFHSFSVLV